MIVVAVVAILAAIAIPSYNRQVEQTRRADAKSGLLTAAQQLERCFTRNNSYENCTVEPTSPDGFFDIAREAPPQAASFLLSATRAGDACSPFTLDHRGNRNSNDAGTRCDWD